MNIIFLGAPGAGKGTVGERLAREHGLTVIATGDIFRQAIVNKTPLGQQVQTIVEAGDLVPDSLTIDLIQTRLAQGDFTRGFILDGFPRNIGQAQALYDWKECPRIDSVVNFEVETQKLIERLSGRLVCRKCGKTYHKLFNPLPPAETCLAGAKHDFYQRSDDTEDSIKKRLSVYFEKTFPLIDFYERKGMLRHLEAGGDPEDVYRHLERLLRFI